MNNEGNPALILFARFPQPGMVKTRLAAGIGKDPAAGFYRLCVEQVLHECALLENEASRYICYSGCSEARFREWSGPDPFLIEQLDGDLGMRLEDAFATVFARGASSAIAIAGDVPDLSACIMSGALSALKSHDVVIGPCLDGGYYLLGMNRIYSELFTGIEWSTPRVLAQTMQAAWTLDLDICSFPRLVDIDTCEDLMLWLSSSDSRSPLYRFAKDMGATGKVLLHA